MYAIVNIQGFQFKVTENYKVYVNRLPQQEGETVEFTEVLLADNEEGDIRVGVPFIEGAKVKAKILKHLKGDKVLVFKKKRRKGYKKLNGHRQYLSQILIEEIEIPGMKKPEKVEKVQETEKKQAEAKQEQKVAEMKVEQPSEEQKTVEFKPSETTEQNTEQN